MDELQTPLISLRDAATQAGAAVGWDKVNGVTINGNPISTSGLTNYENNAPEGYKPNTYYGTQTQIDQLLSPYVYKSPLAGQEQQALDDYQKWAQQPYVSEHAPQIEGLVKNILSRTFQYDPKNDAQFQLASKELTRNVMEAMNQRGILNSTVTENQVQQGVSDLLPQYQQIAQKNFQDEGQLLMSQVDMLMGLDNTQYGRYQDEGSKLANVLDVVMQMDDQQYKKWSDAYERRYQSQQDSIKAAQDKAEADRQKIADAWDRTSELGYVDNKSSIVLGVPAGTLSKEAREAKVQREQELADQKTQLNQQLAVINAQYEKEKKISELKSATLGNDQQTQQYYTFLQAYTGTGTGLISQTIKADPTKANALLIKNKAYIISKIGSKLYDQLVKDVKNSGITKVSTTDYKTDPDFAANVEYINQHHDTALTDIKANSVQLIQDYGLDGYNYLVKLATPPEG